MIKCLKFVQKKSTCFRCFGKHTAERKLYAIDAPKDTTVFFMKTQNAVSTAHTNGYL